MPETNADKKKDPAPMLRHRQKNKNASCALKAPQPCATAHSESKHRIRSKWGLGGHIRKLDSLGNPSDWASRGVFKSMPATRTLLWMFSRISASTSCTTPYYYADAHPGATTCYHAIVGYWHVTQQTGLLITNRNVSQEGITDGHTCNCRT